MSTKLPLMWGYHRLTERELGAVDADPMLAEQRIPNKLAEDEIFSMLCRSVLEGIIDRGCTVWPRPFRRQRCPALDSRIGQLWLLSEDPTLSQFRPMEPTGYSGVADTAIDAMTMADAIVRSSNPGRGGDDRWDQYHPKAEIIIATIDRIRSDIIDQRNTEPDLSLRQLTHLDII